MTTTKRQRPTRVPTELGAKILDAMQRKGIVSQAELSRVAGLSQAHVSQLIFGTRGKRPGAEVIRKLEEALGVALQQQADGTPVSLREYLDSPHGQRLPPEIRDYLSRETLPAGKTATVDDWMVLAAWLKNLPNLGDT